MEIFVQQTINAISLGGTYALLALGLAIIFSIMGMINFAHGELMTITGYALMYCGLAGFPFIIAAPIAVTFAIVSALIRRVRDDDIVPGAVLDGEILARFIPPITVDNMEGIATRQGENGETLIYLVSDDNFSPLLQRTLLLMFELAPEPGG